MTNKKLGLALCLVGALVLCNGDLRCTLRKVISM